MGCDIHAIIEAKHKKDYGSGQIYHDWTIRNEPYIWRNYELFALLAGVRNYDGIIPISEPKGIPEDASEVTKTYVESWGCDGHSHSWLTLGEIKGADISQEFYDHSLILSKEQGIVTGTCRGTTGSHMGEVGWRKVFNLYGDKTFEEIKEAMIQVKESWHTDEDVRLVFFFDN